MPAITYIGHATTLIQTGGSAVLTDPHFGKKVLFAKRLTELEINPMTLPKPSAILISHAHHDHLDLDSFKYFSGDMPVFVPEGLGKFIGKFIKNPVIELKTWSSHTLPNGVEITAVPARHTGFRWSVLRFRQSNGYIISSREGSIFFAGDSAYGEHFKEITRPLLAALIPIGGYSPRCLMRKWNMTPEEAHKAWHDLNAKYFIPIHHSTFRLSLEHPSQPIERLKKLCEEHGEGDRIFILNSGERVELV